MVEGVGGLSLDWEYVDKNKFVEMYREAEAEEEGDFVGSLFGLAGEKLVKKEK